MEIIIVAAVILLLLSALGRIFQAGCKLVAYTLYLAILLLIVSVLFSVLRNMGALEGFKNLSP